MNVCSKSSKLIKWIFVVARFSVEGVFEINIYYGRAEDDIAHFIAHTKFPQNLKNFRNKY